MGAWLSLLTIDMIREGLRRVHVYSAWCPVPSCAQRRALIGAGDRVPMLTIHHVRRRERAAAWCRGMHGVHHQLGWVGSNGRCRDIGRSNRMHARRLVSKIWRIDRRRACCEMRAPTKMSCNLGEGILDNILGLSNVRDVTLQTPDAPTDSQQSRNGSRRDLLKACFTGKTRFPLGFLKQTLKTCMPTPSARGVLSPLTPHFLLATCILIEAGVKSRNARPSSSTYTGT